MYFGKLLTVLFLSSFGTAEQEDRRANALTYLIIRPVRKMVTINPSVPLSAAVFASPVLTYFES